VGSRGWLFLALAPALVVAGCAASRTELVVVVDTDFTLPSEVDAFHITVTRPNGTMADEMQVVTGRADMPLTLGVVADGDALGPIDVVAEALHGGTHVVSRNARVTLVRGETRVLIMYLVRACVAQTCPSDQTCTEHGCAPRMVGDLPRWTGTAPRLGDDAGLHDAGPHDGGIGLDGNTPDAAHACSVASDCDDHNPCTDDACGASGCTHANNSSPCDDGTFCNGVDVCAAGTCSHPGDPCAAPTTCDETHDTCHGCTSRAECPADTMGTFSTCAYADACVVTGTQQRTDLTFACTGGECVATPMMVSAPCTRTTAGMSCGATSCGSFGACSYANGCAQSGTMSQTCTDLTCQAGVCHPVTRSSSAPCTRTTDGNSCGSASCGAWGACEWASTCATSAMRHRTCTDPICSGGSCGSSSPRTEADAMCSRSTDGTSCGGGMVCSGGGCTLCTRTLSGHFGALTGGTYVKNIVSAGATLNLSDGNTPPMTGSVSAGAPITFSGSIAATVAVWQVTASGNTIQFTDWGGTSLGSITVSGATVTGSFGPPCVPGPYGCFPPVIDYVAGSGNQLQLHASDGSSGTITFNCP
jgi:hypothetical protein